MHGCRLVKVTAFMIIFSLFLSLSPVLAQGEIVQANRIVTRVDGYGTTKALIIDTKGQIVQSISNYSGNAVFDKRYTTVFSYDKTGNLIERKSPVSLEGNQIQYAVTKYLYDRFGRAVEKRQSTNLPGQPVSFNVTKYRYDDQGNILLAMNCDEQGKATAISQFYYDKEGNKLREYTGMTEPLLITGLDQISGNSNYSVTKYEYDDANRLIKEIDPLGHEQTYSYDQLGNLCEICDRNGIKTKYTYIDGLFLESKQVYVPGNHSNEPDEETWLWQKEFHGQNMLWKIENGDTFIEKSYDEGLNLQSETDSLGITTQYLYNENEEIVGLELWAGSHLLNEVRYESA